ncbi:hypothetical protein P8452_56747 [Trifolium repens]|nr:hypothetical protein P8452_56747 [Trifolium repens]
MVTVDFVTAGFKAENEFEIEIKLLAAKFCFAAEVCFLAYLLLTERLQELKAFDETKAGVKGLVDRDFTNIDKDPNARQEIISKVREASVTWGFFQVVNHAPNWRDTFKILLAPNPPKPKDLPVVCRDIILEYGAHLCS